MAGLQLWRSSGWMWLLSETDQPASAGFLLCLLYLPHTLAYQPGRNTHKSHVLMLNKHQDTNIQFVTSKYTIQNIWRKCLSDYYCVQKFFLFYFINSHTTRVKTILHTDLAWQDSITTNMGSNTVLQCQTGISCWDWMHWCIDWRLILAC